MRVDAHVHTSFSHRYVFFYDGVDPPELVVKAAAKKGVGVAITDHDTLGGVHRAVEEGKRRGVLVIPGCEITTRDGHLLAYGITEEIPPFLPFEETVERVHDQGGVAVVAHPFAGFDTSVGVSVTDLPADGVEVWNASLFALWQNALAEKVAQSRALARVGGSDAHISDAVGLSVTEFDGEDVDDFVDAVHRGATSVPVRKNIDFFTLSRWLRRRAEMNREYTDAYFGTRWATPLTYVYRILLRLPRTFEFAFLPPFYIFLWLLRRAGRRKYDEFMRVIRSIDGELPASSK